MSRSIWVILVLLIGPAVTQDCVAGIIAISRFDDSSSESVLRFDDAGYPIGSFASAGLSLVHDLSFDSTTGILYGLQRDTPGNLYLASWLQDGSLSSFLNLGIPGASDAGFAELAVHNGVVAISRFDDTIGESVLRFDVAGNFIGTYAGAGLNRIHDLSFDAATGVLYGLQRDVPGNLYLSSWANNGSLLSFTNLGIAGSGDAGDAEIAVFNNLVAISRFDDTVGEPVLKFDSSGTSQGAFAGAGLNRIHDISFDPTTGKLYGLQRDVSGNLHLATWTHDGTLSGFQNLGVAGVGDAGYAELAAYTHQSSVPEPGTAVVWGILISVFSFGVVLNRHRSLAIVPGNLFGVKLRG